MTPDMILTMVVLVFVILVFIFEWVRVDVVGIMMMVLLPLTGLISAKQAFEGMSSNAVCSIIAVIIIGAGPVGLGLEYRANLRSTRAFPSSPTGHLFLVLEDLSVQLVCKLVDGRVHVFRLGLADESCSTFGEQKMSLC